MSRYDATQSNESQRSAKIYRDLDLDFHITPQMTHSLSKQIDLLIKNFEPRARLVQVNVQPFIERNGYRAQISFFVVNTPERVEMESFLERLR